MILGLEISCTRSHSASSTFATIRSYFLFVYKLVYPYLEENYKHKNFHSTSC